MDPDKKLSLFWFFCILFNLYQWFQLMNSNAFFVWNVLDWYLLFCIIKQCNLVLFLLICQHNRFHCFGSYLALFIHIMDMSLFGYYEFIAKIGLIAIYIVKTKQYFSFKCKKFDWIYNVKCVFAKYLVVFVVH